MSDRLYRSTDERMIGGVCGGLAERLDIDPSLVRIVWALLILPTGFIALAAYVVMWLIVPQRRSADPADPARPQAPRRRDRSLPGAPLVVGGVLIVVGTWFLLRELFPVLDPGRFWPVALVILGIGLVVWAYQRSHGDPWGHRP